MAAQINFFVKSVLFQPTEKKAKQEIYLPPSDNMIFVFLIPNNILEIQKEKKIVKQKIINEDSE